MSQVVSKSPQKRSPSKRGRKPKKFKGNGPSIKRKMAMGKHSNEKKAGDEVYGILEERNIGSVQYGLNKRFPTWYGSTVYFDKETKRLGIYDSEGELNQIDFKEESPSPSPNNTDCLKDGDFIWLDTLYVCEYCFKYTSNEEDLIKHDSMCKYKVKTPGKIKYLSPEYTIRRVKGAKHTLFCQCLCLFTKLYLDNKSMYFKVENYDFYILYKTNSTIPMGFFSKDLLSFNENNLACILVFPPYQRKRLGSLLIEFSYKLSRADDLITGPELPLSPFGLVGYLKYWSQVISWQILEGDLSTMAQFSIRDLSQVTGIRIEDIIMTLNHLRCLNQEQGTVYISVLRSWVKSQKADYFQFMVQDEYLLIED